MAQGILEEIAAELLGVGLYLMQQLLAVVLFLPGDPVKVD